MLSIHIFFQIVFSSLCDLYENFAIIMFLMVLNDSFIVSIICF